MRSLDLAIEVWCPRADIDMANVQRLDVPMELRLKLRPVVSLNDVDAEGQPAQDLVDEADGCPLIAGVVDLGHANASAVVNGGELIQPLVGARNTLEKLGEIPKCRQSRATLREAPVACCGTLSRHVRSRICAAFVIGSPCREFATK